MPSFLPNELNCQSKVIQHQVETLLHLKHKVTQKFKLCLLLYTS